MTRLDTKANFQMWLGRIRQTHVCLTKEVCLCPCSVSLKSVLLIVLELAIHKTPQSLSEHQEIEERLRTPLPPGLGPDPSRNQPFIISFHRWSWTPVVHFHPHWSLPLPHADITNRSQHPLLLTPAVALYLFQQPRLHK